VAGIIHAAGLGAYRPILQEDLSSFEEVCAAKVAGTWNLRFLSSALDFWICCSSMVATWGARAQAAYVAANQFLDSFADLARPRRIPVLSVGWGPLEGGGMLPLDSIPELKRMGIHTLTLEQAVRAMDWLAALPGGQTTLVSIDWNRFLGVYASKDRLPFFDQVASLKILHPLAQHEILEKIQSEIPSERAGLLTRYLQDLLGEILRLDPQEPPSPEEGFWSLGMDSLTAMEFTQRLQKDLNLDLPSTLPFDYGDFYRLVPFLLAQLNLTSAPKENR